MRYMLLILRRYHNFTRLAVSWREMRVQIRRRAFEATRRRGIKLSPSFFIETAARADVVDGALFCACRP